MPKYINSHRNKKGIFVEVEVFDNNGKVVRHEIRERKNVEKVIKALKRSKLISDYDGSVLLKLYGGE